MVAERSSQLRVPDNLCGGPVGGVFGRRQAIIPLSTSPRKYGWGLRYIGSASKEEVSVHQFSES